MKHLLPLLLIIVTWSASAAMSFTHPGALDSKTELDFVKSKIRAGEQPWAGEFQDLKKSSEASHSPHGREHINARGDGAEESKHDAISAYTHALLWYYTDDESHARRAVAILNSWASLQDFNGGTEQDRLHAGWVGACFAPAAEILRLYPDLKDEDVKRLQSMFRRAFYPQLNTASHWNGNVDLSQIDAMFSIAVFNEDEEEFNLAVERLRKRVPAYFYLRSDGPSPRGIAGANGDLPRFWFNPGKWVDGLTQETCRDNGHHAQFGLGSALHAAETAWHQGIDLYKEHQERLTAAMELMASQFLAGSMLGVSGDDRPSATRVSTWEMGYGHYHGRLGLALPATGRLIHAQIRPDAVRNSCNLNNEILTHSRFSSE